MRAEPPQPVEYVRESWPADPRLGSEIRHAVHDWLDTLPLSQNEVADVVLAVDEAVENVIKHAYTSERIGSAELVLWTELETLCIEVIDYGEWRAPTGSAQGLGIPMMEKLVESIMIHFDERGTRVLLRYPLPAETPESPKS
ncbi:MAG: ATP-binding protein [Actinomycetota bacterium]|nr:ATP-binding protein [Actinomycetota bacterium]